MIDFFVSLALLFAAAVIAGAFVVRRASPIYARVQRDGGSALLGTRSMNVAYWALQPIVRGCLRFGITANEITVASVVLAFAAGVLLAFGHFGLAAAVTAVGSLGDALDGLVARASRTASDAGELLDAAADRYGELFFLGGLAVHYRGTAWALVLTLAAVQASFMVSYGSAKAEALGVPCPRGAMRRSERATYLALGAVLVPMMVAAANHFHAAAWWMGESPMLAALALVASVGNVSAVRRLAAIARGVMPAATPRRAGFVATLGRHQIGSLVATAVDFGTMTSLVEAGLAGPVQATLAGACLGAFTNFTLGRRWIFRARDEATLPQAVRYALVSGVGASLNGLGEHIVAERAGVQYIVARACVAVFVSLAWNFPMQRRFVFRQPGKTRTETRSP